MAKNNSVGRVEEPLSLALGLYLMALCCRCCISRTGCKRFVFSWQEWLRQHRASTQMALSTRMTNGAFQSLLQLLLEGMECYPSS